MIKNFKLFESEEDIIFTKKIEFSISDLMEQISGERNRVEILTILLNDYLKDNYVSFEQREGKILNTENEIIDKILIIGVYILLESTNGDLSVSVFCRDENNKDYCLSSAGKIQVWKRSKRIITKEDPYGEEDWS